MTLRNAAILAFMRAPFVAAFLVWNLALDIVAVVRRPIPAVRIFSAFLYAFARGHSYHLPFVFCRDPIQ